MNTYIYMMGANAITYSASVVIILSTMISVNRKRLILAAIVLVLVMFSLTPVISQSWLIPPILLTVLLYSKSIKWHKILFYSLSSVFIVWILDASVSSALMLITPNWHGGLLYNYMMCALNMTVSLIILCFPALTKPIIQIKFYGYLVALQIAIIVYFSLFLTQFYSEFNAFQKRQIAVLTFLLMLFVFTVWILTRKATHLENEATIQEQRADLQHDFGVMLSEQFKSLSIIRHYSDRMIKSMFPYLQAGDMEGLQEYFTEYIMPLGNEIKGSQQNHLMRMNSKLIRSLFETALQETAVLLPNTVIDFNIDGALLFPPGMEIDLFKILSIYIDNAQNALIEQSRGLLQITGHGTHATVLLEVSNSVSNCFEINDLVRTPAKWEQHGHGLNHVRELSLNYPNMVVSTLLTDSQNGKLLHQKVEIAL